ncbi:uncharacterized protein UV8b_04620 [Ustilaginoidea virens]|uniref:NAD-dependent epimerase/dehydratase domain-containing protein n=1 Tax=Ustilaginoidea virens TaxID=1159556 RepID=A0A8E5HRS8_USTVR|nr:uncharacterized protein UV8b_04620 [Ustilaginoidea virens]QUC20379.1 hypothetical protein UV8b_04620 [Ustilaginoidea virens]
MTSPTPLAAVVVGSTGLVGSSILSNLLADDTYKPTHTISRRAPQASSPNLNAVVTADTAAWPAALRGLSPPPATFFSALGTTRAAAGGIANQWKIDHDLNVELARAARDAGVRTFVLVSSGGTRGLPFSLTPYARMKNGVEDAVRELGFEHAIVVRPGMILGEREQHRLAEGVLQAVVRGLGRLSPAAQDAVGQDAGVIARAAVRAARLADEGGAPGKYWVLEAGDILRLGRTDGQGAGADSQAGAGAGAGAADVAAKR